MDTTVSQLAARVSCALVCARHGTDDAPKVAEVAAKSAQHLGGVGGGQGPEHSCQAARTASSSSSSYMRARACACVCFGVCQSGGRHIWGGVQKHTKSFLVFEVWNTSSTHLLIQRPRGPSRRRRRHQGRATAACAWPQRGAAGAGLPS